MKQLIIIRKEFSEDCAAVIELTEKAFAQMEFSNGDEGKLVDRLRLSAAFIPELSLVAEQNGQLVGHILFTRMHIQGETKKTEILSLAPVSVLPEFQNQGIGSRLIEAGHQKAMELGFGSVILVGHPNYYPRFGYQPASKWRIKAPFALPSDDVFMAVELVPGALNGAEGTIVYPPEFGL